MIGWKFPTGRTDRPDSSATDAPLPSAPAPAGAGGPIGADAAEVADWSKRLQAAVGDDAALLALASTDAPLEIKLAAVGAITGEEALRLAEREFRNHDRRVHRIAKQRYGDCVARREARAQAGLLIDTARALLDEPLIAANRLVELDRGWLATNPALLEDDQRSEYGALLERLRALVRARADDALQAKQWMAQARVALAGLRSAADDAASGAQPRRHLAEASVAAQALVDATPDSATCAALREELDHALLEGALLDRHLAVLDEVLRGPAAARDAAVQAPTPGAEALPEAPVAATDAAMEAAASAGDASAEVPASAGDASTEVPASAGDASTEVPVSAGDASAEVPAPDADPVGASPTPVAPAGALQRWTQLPPLANARHAQALQLRFEQWQRERDDERQARRARQREQTQDRQRKLRGERAATLARTLEQAQAALAAGHLADAHKRLVDIDRQLDAGAPADALRASIDQAQAQYAQLKGWQQWGGGRARDELVLQAEALAAVGGDARPGGVKLSLKQRAEVIADMRARWKELDRLGGATSRPLWQRFEQALKAAHQPVAEHLAAQRVTREQNLAARQQLIEALDAVPLPDGDGDADGTVTAPWRAIATALDQFRGDWRRLGPIEHTVPHKARDPLMARMAAAVERLEAPLDRSRRGARAGRERLIERAEALGAEASGGMHGRELVERVRALQAEWQHNARSLPLGRADENALWTRFKGALDAIFSARDAEINAREAQFKAHGAERAALIDRLAALSADTPVAEIRRTLAEVDALWHQAGPAPRSDAAALDARFARAHDAARQWLAGSAQRSWNATCDTLVAKLALCDEIEAGTDPAAARPDALQRWAGLPALPKPWEAALSQRAGASTPDRGAAGAAGTDDLLLQLETAWGLASPAEFEAARRQLKLQAMKQALEGRRSTAALPTTPEQCLVEVLGRRRPSDAQRRRLGALIDALRQRPPVPADAPRPAPMRPAAATAPGGARPTPRRSRRS